MAMSFEGEDDGAESIKSGAMKSANSQPRLPLIQDRIPYTGVSNLITILVLPSQISHSFNSTKKTREAE